jgi:2-polyprenyl-3-methyl-5-hydroxy-6-metoxy-1,4-benzoquinol methylase
MPEDILVATLAAVRRHPWMHARAHLVLGLLNVLGVRPPSSVIEVGCGWGFNLTALEEAGYHVDGMDISRRVLEKIDTPQRRLIVADVNQPLPPDAGRYDALLALDVIEHLDDDQGAVRHMRSLLRPGGAVIISVPALPDLFSDFDRIQGHRRRYLPETLRLAVESEEFEVLRIFWWGAWMVPLLRRMRRQNAAAAQKPRTYADYWRLPPWPAPPLFRLAYALEENRAVRGKLRTGTSLFAVLRSRS